MLVLDKVTPVIKALFGPFELDENYPGKGHAYIANLSKSSDCSWDSVLENLQALAEELDQSLPADADECVEEYLRVLAAHFSADQDEALNQLIEHGDFEEDADLDSLFTIARAFNDGHGLKAYMTESAWRCSKPHQYEYGGSGEFVGLHASVGGSSNQVVQLGEALEAALTAGDTAKAADVLFKQVKSTLAGIRDESARLAIRSTLGDLLATPKAKYFAVTGRIPGDDEDTLHVFQATTREEALTAFEAAMWANKTEAETGRENVFKAHGQTVFVNSIVASEAPILKA